MKFRVNLLPPRRKGDVWSKIGCLFFGHWALRPGEKCMFCGKELD